MTPVVSALRDGGWLTRERLLRWAWVVLGCSITFVAFLLVTAHGMTDFLGRPLGTDFSAFYAAGRVALSGANPYDQVLLYHTEQTLFGDGIQFYGFAYPPIFLLVAAPLATLPYAVSLLLWQIGTFGFYLWAMARVREAFAPNLPKVEFLLLAAAFTAVIVNLGHGQNGFLSAALFALAFALLERQPIGAGIVFGLLSYKPQLAMLVPFALAAGGRWRSFLSAGLTFLVLAAASAWLFGPESWRHFLHATQFSRHAILDLGGVGYEKMVSVFAWARLWHAPLALAYALQAAAAAAVLALTVLVWRTPADLRLKIAVLVLGTLLTTPFALDYDLMLLAPAIALVASHGAARSFASYQACVIALLWLVPLFQRPLAALLFIPLAAWSTIAAFASVTNSALKARVPITSA